jgi:hypothetical protein
VSIQPATTLTLFKVGPAQWKLTDEDALDSPHDGPITFEDYGLTPDDDADASLIIGTAVCHVPQLYDQPRLEVYLLDNMSHIYAQADISLAPMSGQNAIGRQPVSLKVPADLHNQFSSMDWQVIPGSPLNDGLMLPTKQIVRIGEGRNTQLRISLENTQDRSIDKLSLSIRPVDDHGKPLVHWQGQWQGVFEPGKELILLMATPLDDDLPRVADWQVNIAAEQVAGPRVSGPLGLQGPSDQHDQLDPHEPPDPADATADPGP